MTESPKIHAKHVDARVDMIISVGTADRQRSIEDFLADVDRALRGVAGVKNVTLTRPYYILDGKVCLPEDYDPATGTFKEGATPPSWAGGPSEAERRQKAKEKERAEEIAKDEAPVRKVRSDKGQPRGPRTSPTDAQKAKVVESAEKLSEAMSDG